MFVLFVSDNLDMDQTDVSHHEKSKKLIHMFIEEFSQFFVVVFFVTAVVYSLWIVESKIGHCFRNCSFLFIVDNRLLCSF